MWAIKGGHEQAAKILIMAGASVNQQNFEGYFPLFFAVEQLNLAMVTLLCSSGANVNLATLEGVTAAHIAAASGCCELLHLLYKYGMHLYALDNHGETILHYAIREGQRDMVRFIFSHYYNELVYHYEPYHGKTKMEVVKSYEVDPMESEETETPLELAISLGEWEIVSLFHEFFISQPKKIDSFGICRASTSTLFAKPTLPSCLA